MEMKSLGGRKILSGLRMPQCLRPWLTVAACAYGLVVLPSTAVAEPAAAGARPRPAPTQHESAALEKRVTLLSAELSLDAQQQAQVRRILEDQREQVMRVWNDPSLAAANRVIATRIVSDRTADRIRAILTEEQKAKYNQARKPRAAGENAASPSVEEWMKAAAAK
jgi:Spy/CpxP family protein refolding chaperone